MLTVKRDFATYDAAIEARARASETFQLHNLRAADEYALLSACQLGIIKALHQTALDYVAAARQMLRDGNIGGAQMFLDMIEDPREGKS